MKAAHSAFPLIVGLTGVIFPRNSAALAGGLRKTLAELRALAPAGIYLLHVGGDPEMDALILAIGEDLIVRKELRATGSPSGTGTLELALVEACDLVIVLNGEAKANEELVAYAQEIGLSTVRIETTTGRLLDPIPAQLTGPGDWLPGLFEAADLSAQADLQTVYSHMDALANMAAPVTRGWWKWIVLFQGLAVLVPLAWLIQRTLGVPSEYVTLVTFLSVLLLVGGSWWLRWRGMQKTWARARLVAEVARSFLATAHSPGDPALEIAGAVPTLRHLRWIIPNDGGGQARQFPEWREAYLRERVEDQQKYFAAKEAQAVEQRRQLTRWTTLLLDLALAIGTVSLVVFFSARWQEWNFLLGGYRLEIFLGVAGAALPLGLLQIQTLRTVYELNRRAARFAQQQQMLGQGKARLARAPTASAALAVISDIERQLLAEVLEWYFHAETAEHFFQVNLQGRGPRMRKRAWDQTKPLTARFISVFGVAGLFCLRVVLGRILWVICSLGVVMGAVSYYHASYPEIRAAAGTNPVFFDSDGLPWNPSVERAAHGCVIIVHGLGDSVNWKETGTAPHFHWMKATGVAIESRLKETDGIPNVCLVDWSEAADPSSLYRLLPPITHAGFLMNVAAIRPTAYNVGDLLAFRIAGLIYDGVIRKDRPLHLIGHSAGGFIVARIAIILKQLGMAPDGLHVTLLDTPGPDNEILTKLPKACPGAVDFYVTSELVHLPGKLDTGLHVVREPTPVGDNLIAAHAYATEWFCKSISDHNEKEGFARSPLMSSQ